LRFAYAVAVVPVVHYRLFCVFALRVFFWFHFGLRLYAMLVYRFCFLPFGCYGYPVHFAHAFPVVWIFFCYVLPFVGYVTISGLRLVTFTRLLQFVTAPRLLRCTTLRFARLFTTLLHGSTRVVGFYQFSCYTPLVIARRLVATLFV